MNDNHNCRRPSRPVSRQKPARGYDEFAASLCDAILLKVTERRLTTYGLAQLGVFVRRDDIMRLRDGELHLHWSLHRLAHFADALGIHIEFSMRFDDELKKAA